MSRLGNLIINVGANTKEFNKELGRVNRAIQQTTGNIQQLGRNMSLSMTAPLAFIAGTGVKTFMDFEQQMAKVQAVSGATSSEFKSLQENAMDLGKSTRFSASEVAMLQEEFAKLGFSAQEITKVTEGTLALAQASGSDLAQAANVAGSTLRALGLDVSETGRVTDVMAASFSSTALDMQKFQDSMKYVAPQARAAGLSIETTTAMLGALANAGITGSQAGTSLRAIIQRLAANGEDLTTVLSDLSKENLSLADAQGLVDREASSALLVLMNSIDEVGKLDTQFQGAAGSAKAMADIMDDTAEGSMKRMMSAIEGAQIEIGQALAPAMISAMDAVAGLAAGFADMSDGAQTVILTIAGVAAAIGPVLVVLPQLAKGFMLAKSAATAMNLSLLTNPYVLAAGALAALGAVVYEMSTAVDSATWAQEQLSAQMVDAGREAGNQMAQVSKLTAAVKSEALSEEQRYAALMKLKQISPEHFGNLDLETAKTNELARAVDNYRASLLEAAKTKAMEKQLQAIEEQLLALEQGGNLQEAGWFAKGIAYLSEGQEGLEKMQQRFNKNSQQALLAQREMLLNQMTAVGDVSAVVSEASAGMQNFTAATVKTAEAAVETKKELTDLEYALQQIQTLGDDPLSIDLKVRQQEQVMSGGMNLQEIDDSWMDTADEDTDWEAMGEEVNAFYDNMDARLQNTKQMTDELTASMGTFLGSMIKGGPEAGNALKQFGRSAVRTLFQVVKAAAVASASQTAASMGPGAAAALPILIGGALSLVEGLLGAIAFADGGIVSGPTLGLVGEYAGARNNPEVIAPLDKLRSMIAETGGGHQEVTVTGRISGNDIELISERGRNNLRRSR